MTDTAEKGCKADASCLAHLFQNCFWLPTKLVFKIAPWVEKFSLLLVKIFPLFNKSISISNGKVFQNSTNIFPFHKESNFNSFLNLTLFKSYL